MPKLSIIVPVYKTELYLPKCIDSILTQKYKDFELILIDDGSPDRCGQICDEYAKKDIRIKVIHQKNQGVSAARNAGLDIAQGEYIGFVDSDDWIEPEMYEVLVKIALEKKLDVAICGINYFCEDGTFIRSDLGDSKLYNAEMLLTALYGKPNPLGGVCWNKIFLRSKVDQCRFQRNLSMAEDWVYLFESFQYCKKAYKISDAFYNVLERRGSATRENEMEALYQIVFGGKLSLQLTLARGYSHELECIATDKYMDDCIRYSNLIRQVGENTEQHWYWKFARIRLQIMTILPRVYLKKLLPKEKIHGYLYEMIKL